MNIKSQIKSILVMPTLRQSSLTFATTIVNGGLGALFYIFVARKAGLYEFGVFTLAITVSTLITDISDLGTDSGLVNFIGRNAQGGIDKVKAFIKLGLVTKLVVSICVGLVGFVLAPLLANYIFSKPDLTTALRLGFVGVSTALLFSLGIRVFQGLEKYVHWSLLYIGTNTLRLLLVLLFVRFASANFFLIVYITVPLIGLFFALHWFPEKILSAKVDKHITREFFHYNKWVAVFIFIAAISSRMDTFISARLLSAADIGLYGAATQASSILPQLVAAIGTVVAPKMTVRKNKKDFLSYFKKVTLLISAISFCSLLLIPIGIFVLPILFGKVYVGSGSAFTILVLSGIVFLLSVPIHMSVIYYYQYPKLFVYISFVHLILVTNISLILIPKLGITGAAIAALMGSVSNFVLPSVWLWRRLRMEEV